LPVPPVGEMIWCTMAGKADKEVIQPHWQR
jgi:hypothetical protein